MSILWSEVAVLSSSCSYLLLCKSFAQQHAEKATGWQVGGTTGPELSWVRSQRQLPAPGWGWAGGAILSTSLLLVPREGQAGYADVLGKGISPLDVTVRRGNRILRRASKLHGRGTAIATFQLPLTQQVLVPGEGGMG